MSDTTPSLDKWFSKGDRELLSLMIENPELREEVLALYDKQTAELTRLRAEHDALVERLWGLMTPGCKWISAADLERVLNAPPGNTPRG